MANIFIPEIIQNEINTLNDNLNNVTKEVNSLKQFFIDKDLEDKKDKEEELKLLKELEEEELLKIEEEELLKIEEEELLKIEEEEKFEELKQALSSPESVTYTEELSDLKDIYISNINNQVTIYEGVIVFIGLAVGIVLSSLFMRGLYE